MSWIISNALMRDYENSLCLQEQAAESLAESSSGGEPSAPLNGSHTPLAFLPPDKMTAFSRLSRFGTTFAPLTENRGEDVLTWFLGASPVRTSHAPEKALESTANDLECGWRWHGSFVKRDRVSSSWKTRQCSLLAGLDVFSETWPKWGMMRDGECLELATLERPTSESESGSLPTPRATDGDKGTRTAQGAAKEWARGRNKDLGMIVAIWPTPQAHKITRSGQIVNADGAPSNGITKPHSKTSGRPIATALADAVAMWPTPQASDNRDRGNLGSGAILRRKEKGKQIGLSQSVSDQSGALNPPWVEWLMAWPIEWTDLKPLGTAKFQRWRFSHGESSVNPPPKK